jgi:phosphoadenosine phosphosulfate reductase
MEVTAMPNGKELSEDRIRELETYIHISKNIIREAYRQFAPEDIRLVWSGNKDSTLTLWIWRETCLQYGLKLPKAVTLEEGDSFEEVEEFLKKISKEWGVELDVTSNTDVLKACNYTLDADVEVKKLSQRNQQEIERIGFGGLERFPFEPESYIGNHLMKSVALNTYLEATNIKIIVQGLRWDEHPVRADDAYFEEVKADGLQPEQTRIRPILHPLCTRLPVLRRKVHHAKTGRCPRLGTGSGKHHGESRQAPGQRKSHG